MKQNPPNPEPSTHLTNHTKYLKINNKQQETYYQKKRDLSSIPLTKSTLQNTGCQKAKPKTHQNTTLFSTIHNYLLV
jgi:hypothetical protein